jgi:hypothetical protein
MSNGKTVCNDGDGFEEFPKYHCCTTEVSGN